MIVHIYNILSLMLPTRFCWAVRRFFLRMCGVRLGRGVKVSAGIFIVYNNLEIGDDVWVGPLVRFYSTITARIEVGANCDIAPEVSFVTGTHQLGRHARRAGVGESSAIKIGDGCWLGARSTILGGVCLGAGSVVAAGALVLPGVYGENVLLAGVPAVVKRNYSAE